MSVRQRLRTEHDAYTKVLNRLLRDLRVEKAKLPARAPWSHAQHLSGSVVD